MLVVENKVGAREGGGVGGKGQLEAYFALLEQEKDASTRTLVYITHASADPPANPAVVHLRWFEIHEWLREWLERNGDDGSEAVVAELVELLEDWSMNVSLTNKDLASATRWHTSTRRRLENILAYIRGQVGDCVQLEPGSSRINYDKEYLWFRSPELRGHAGICLEFAFDFVREDDVWSVSELQRPSAYAAIYSKSDTVPRPLGWDNLDEWTDENYRWTKQISEFSNAPTEAYMSFFQEAIQDVSAALENG